MFTAGLFITTGRKQSKCLSTEKWASGISCIQQQDIIFDHEKRWNVGIYQDTDEPWTHSKWSQALSIINQRKYQHDGVVSSVSVLSRWPNCILLTRNQTRCKQAKRNEWGKIEALRLRTPSSFIIAWQRGKQGQERSKQGTLTVRSPVKVKNSTTCL